MKAIMAMTTQKCRICGCTDDDCRQCIERTGKPCYWVEGDLCSACGVYHWKIKPTLFSTPMVKSLLDGIKSKTRRTKGLEGINDDPGSWNLYMSGLYQEESESGYLAIFLKTDGSWISQACLSRYNVGDILWVRETYKTKYIKGGLDGFKLQYPGVCPWIYATDGLAESKGYGSWKPSIHMPKEAARIFLKVTDVSVERLQDISDEDAVAEGIMPLAMSAMQRPKGGQLYVNYCNPEELFMDGLPPIESFISLWCSINGKDSWGSNPWVWVYEFERVARPSNFLDK